MLGTAVVVVEGDSDKWWLDAAGQLLHGVPDGKFTHEAFDLTGITVVSSETHGDSIKTAVFFSSLNLPVVILLDKLDDEQVVANHVESKFPTIFLRQVGIERAIAEEIPLSLVTSFLTDAPLTSGQNCQPAELSGKNDAELRKLMFNLLKKNKGSKHTHEWVIDQLTLQSFPSPILESVRMANQHFFASRVINGALCLIA
jgi:hypothetical protein